MFATVFGAVFLAELGDKTQIATLLFASDKDVSKMLVFAAAALALIMTSAIGVLAGGALSHYIDEKQLSWIAGAGFILIGAWTLYQA
jgi:putative Ca2+/H+ antiporter (TMEM165/GDT1 family)